jgi:hypothetical protein
MSEKSCVKPQHSKSEKAASSRSTPKVKKLRQAAALEK